MIKWIKQLFTRVEPLKDLSVTYNEDSHIIMGKHVSNSEQRKWIAWHQQLEDTIGTYVKIDFKYELYDVIVYISWEGKNIKSYLVEDEDEDVSYKCEMRAWLLDRVMYVHHIDNVAYFNMHMQTLRGNAV